MEITTETDLLKALLEYPEKIVKIELSSVRQIDLTKCINLERISLAL